MPRFGVVCTLARCAKIARTLMEPEAASNTVLLSVSLRTDRDQFLRRTCPSCGRDFKTEADAADLQWALEAYCRRAGVEIGETGEAENSAPPHIRCPYCGHDGEINESLTEETAQYLKRILYREVVLPKMNNFFSGLEDSIGTGPHAGGMFSISVEFKHSPLTRPVRPIHGPDAPNFKIVTFMCCGKKIKISEQWRSLDICSFCGAEVAVI